MQKQLHIGIVSLPYGMWSSSSPCHSGLQLPSVTWQLHQHFPSPPQAHTHTHARTHARPEDRQLLIQSILSLLSAAQDCRSGKMAMALPLSSQPQTGCLHSSRTSSHNIRSCTRIGPPFMPAELRATRHGSRRSIRRDRRQPPLIVAPQSTSSSVAGDQPAELLAAIASLRRQGGGPEAKDTVIRCVEALEEQVSTQSKHQ